MQEGNPIAYEYRGDIFNMILGHTFLGREDIMEMQDIRGGQ